MSAENNTRLPNLSRQDEEHYLEETLRVIHNNIQNYGQDVRRMREEIDVILDHFHDDNPELINQLENTITLHDHMKRALDRNERARNKPYFGRIVFHDETYEKDESLYVGRSGISRDATHLMVVDWRAPVANAYYENGLGKCSYLSPEGKDIKIDLQLKRTYEIDGGRLQNYFDSEVIANDELLTKYLAKNKQAVLGEIVATIQKEQNEIIRKTPYHNIIVQGVAGSGKTTVAMHRISYILYNYAERFKPDDFYIVGSNRILLNYITGVLPDLDVYGVRQMTMEQLFVRLLYEDWDENKYRIKSTDRTGQKYAIKGSLSWFRDLEYYCNRLEWNMLPRESVYLNPLQFVEGFQDGKAGVFDRTDGKPADPKDLILLVDGTAVERYIRQNPTISLQSKINMLNERLSIKVKDAFLGKGVKYTEAEMKAISKAYRGRYGANVWKQSIFDIYRDFLKKQIDKGYDTEIPTDAFDVYDLAALSYLYKRIKETEVISEAHHVVIDEAQDFGMMAYCVLKFCIKDCTYTIMGDVSQNIHFGYGLNDWEELKKLYLSDPMSTFGILKKSYRNTVEISEFATNILHHGQFSVYPVEPIIRHGNPVAIHKLDDRDTLIQKTAQVCKDWQTKGLDTIAIICRNQEDAAQTSKELGQYVSIMESDLEKAEFGNGIMVLPVEYTKGLEFDAVLILNPTREEYPADDGHAKLLYVAATRALHELCVLHTGNLTGLIADPVPERKVSEIPDDTTSRYRTNKPTNRSVNTAVPRKPKPQIKTNTAPNPSTLYGTSTQTASPARRMQTTQIQAPYKAAGTTPDSSVSTLRTTSCNTAAGSSSISFGDMPVAEILRPEGHTRIDLAVRWVSKQQDGLYLQSRYGVLRLSPINGGIIRITFAKGGRILDNIHSEIKVTKTDRAWMYKDSAKTVDLMTDELCLSVDKATGAIKYLTRDKKLLLAERPKECRQIECSASQSTRCRLYLDWQKDEKLYGIGAGNSGGLELRGSARYISHGKNASELPLLLSDKGYGILIAADGPTFVCDIPTYGSYLYTEKSIQMDYYFIAGKKPGTILSAYAYLTGKL